MDVVTAISTLLFEHERVVVPGLGEFTTEYVAASIHPVEHSFNPAYKKIRFQYNEQVNDDLLPDFLSKHPASRSLADFVAEVKEALKAGRKFQLKNIGFLYAHHTGEIVLEQDLSFNYVKENFGLTPFIQKPVQKKISEEPKVVAAPAAAPKERKSYAWLIALAAILIIGVLVFWQWNTISSIWEPGNQVADNTLVTNQDDKGSDAGSPANQNANDLPVADTVDTEADTIPANEAEGVVSDEAAVVEEDIPETAEAEINVTVENTGQTAESAVQEEPAPLELKGVVYYVIAGCFESKMKAEELAANLRNEGFEHAQVHGKIGRLYRVCYTAFPTKREANRFQKRLNDEGKTGVWIQRARW
jgi:cell division septation protein DedD/nucleoid DNA-binding protein